MDLSRCLDSQLVRHSVLDTIGIDALCLTLSYLYSNYCMKNTSGMNQISDLKGFYPSVFVFGTFDTGRFSQHNCVATGGGTYGKAEQSGWVIVASFHERQQ